MIDAVQENLGVPVNHYVEVDFVAFQRLVEAVGGVPVYVPAPVRDRNSGLNIGAKGCVMLDPYQALAFRGPDTCNIKSRTVPGAPIPPATSAA